MSLLQIARRCVGCLVLAALAMPVLMAQVCPSGTTCVLTQHNDTSRTGQNLQETALNTGNVSVANFGLQFSLPVTGNTFAQPLYVANLTIAGATHNVIYVATAENNVYAFDADSGNTTPLWTVGQNDLGTPVPSQDICSTDPSECPYSDTIPVIGILATPVIDPSSETMYVVANSKDSSGNYHFKLHALDLTTGAEKFGGPTEITATGLTQLTQNCRPGLLLANGMVYLGMGSVGDFPTWHGYVMAYDASTLQQVAVYNSTPENNSEGGAGIWQAGNGLVADANGDVYAVTSNGNFDVNTGGQDYGSAYLKLNGSTLSVVDYFVPYNQAMLNPEEDNVDLGSGGPLLIPNTTLLVGTGKDAVLRVVNTTTGEMGEYNPNTNDNVQNISNVTNPPVLGSPVYWNSPSLGPVIYLWGPGTCPGGTDALKAWGFNGQKFNTVPVSESTILGAPCDASALSISAHGNGAGTGILWATGPISGASNPGPTAGIVYAFDASDLTHEIWDSQQNSSRDALGNWAKFNAPMIANGKVYVATFCPVDQNGNCSGPAQVQVYGLLAKPAFTLSAAPSSQSVGAGSSASYVVYVTPQAGYNGTVTLTCSGLPSGVSCSPASISVPAGSSQPISTPLTVTTSSTTAGTFTFTITGTSGSLVQNASAQLTITGGSSPSFTLSSTQLTPTSIGPGGSATSQVTVSPSSGFNSSVSLSCSIAPASSVPPTCKFSSSAISGGSGTSTLTVSTVAATASLNSKSLLRTYYAIVWPLFGLTVIGSFRASRRKVLRWLLIYVTVLGAICMVACGGGSGSGGGGTGSGTTPGNYTVTVTGTSGSLTQTQTLNFTVQ